MLCTKFAGFPGRHSSVDESYKSSSANEQEAGGRRARPHRALAVGRRAPRRRRGRLRRPAGGGARRARVPVQCRRHAGRQRNQTPEKERASRRRNLAEETVPRNSNRLMSRVTLALTRRYTNLVLTSGQCIRLYELWVQTNLVYYVTNRLCSNIYKYIIKL